MTTPNKRWRELAEKLVSDYKFVPGEWIKISERDCVLMHDIEQAIATAVNEERARMVVVWPSDEVLNKGCAEWYKNRTDNDHPLEMLQVIWGGCYRWLRTQAKIGQRDEKAVAEERAKARIVWPREDQYSEALEMAQSRFKPFYPYEWLREQAKIEWGDE